MSAVPILSAQGLSKSFGAVRVIHEISFEVWPGEVLGVLGPNGAGKTTLFNLISGDVAVDGGNLRFQGEALKGGEPPFKRCRRGIGRTYQVPRPYSGMTTFENLLVAAMFGGMQSERVANDRCAAILDDCGLGDKANQLAGSLTLLDRKRLELARALASGPKLLLLDEIAGGLTDE
ncbi:MAG: ATP-binding cassette domain-containing protein [Burkholderiales bacterium]|nr:ATP-binding cassette domain-containing protein [Burkholderiales bacterium]